MSQRLFAIRAVLFSLACVALMRAQPAPEGIHIAIDGVPAAWSFADSDVPLRVIVTDDSGQPVAGKSVVFVAPDQGPSGTLAGGAWMRVYTADDGSAGAVLHTNTAIGPFLASAWIEGTQQAVHYAISNVASNTTPALDAATALQAVNDALQPDASAIVYGPFLLEAGVQVAMARATATDAPVALDRQTVFFWIDDYPPAGYDHPVRYVVLDAGNASPDLTAAGAVLNRTWYPVVSQADGSAAALVAPLFRIPEIPPPPADQLPGRRYADPNSDVCAVVVYGPDSTAFENSAADMRGVFKDVLMIPEANILEDTTSGILGTSHRPSTPSRIKDLLNQAKAKNCKKLYFYFAGHGYQGGFCAAHEGSGKAEYDDFNYDTLAMAFQQTMAPQICPILQCCHAGSAIPAMQNHGFSGAVATASATNGLAYHNPIPGFREAYWTAALASTWRDLATLGPEQDISLPNVALAVGEGRDPNSYVMTGMPRVANIDPMGGMAAAPNVTIADLANASDNPKSFTVTAPAGFAPGDGSVEVNINDVSVAVGTDNVAAGMPTEHNSRVVLRNGARNATFTVQGLKQGVTTYTLTFTDSNGKTYTGTGTISVGEGYKVTPNPAGMHAGSSAQVTLTRGTVLAASASPVLVAVQPADDASAAIATVGGNGVELFNPGASSTTFTVMGLKAGTATFKVSDGTHSTTFQVLVDNMALNPAKLQLNMGQTAFVQLVREGPVLASPTVPVINIRRTSTVDYTVATVTPMAFPYPTDQRSLSFTVTGLANGNETFQIIDPSEGFMLTLPVIVGQEGPSSTGVCGLPFTGNATFTPKLDPAEHDLVIQLRQALMGISLNGTMVTVTASGNPNLVIATGPLNQTMCSFTADGTGVVAGRSNIEVEYILQRNGNNWTGTVELGKGGGLPTNQSIIYNVVLVP